MSQSNDPTVPEALKPLLDALALQLKATVGAQLKLRRPTKLNPHPQKDYDAVFEVTVPDVEPFPLVVECLKLAYPGEVQHRIFKLQAAKLTIDRPKPGYAPDLLGMDGIPDRPWGEAFVYTPRVATVVAAEAFSPGAMDMLEKASVGYFDLQSGALFFRAPGLYVKIKPVEKARGRKASRGTMDLFTDARTCVVHALLHRRYEWLTGEELAELAETSTYTCSKVLQELENRGWCESEGSKKGAARRRLVNPGALLDAWAKASKSRQGLRTKWYAYINDESYGEELARALKKSGNRFPWALTGAEAGNLYAPLLTGHQPVEIVIPPGKLMSVIDAGRLKPVDKGANVTVIERAPASLLFRNQLKNGTWIVSPFIAYLDLLDGRGRNKELAEALRQKLELDKNGT